VDGNGSQGSQLTSPLLSSPPPSSPRRHHLGFIRRDSTTTRLTAENTPHHTLGERAVLADAAGAPGAQPRAASIPLPRCAAEQH